MVRKAVIGLGCLAAIAGCGGPEEDQVADVVKEYHRATIAGDIEKACGLTADEMWAEADCEDIVELNGLPSRRELATRLAEGSYDVTIDGGTATAQGKNLGIFTPRKVDGDWKLIDTR